MKNDSTEKNAEKENRQWREFIASLDDRVTANKVRFEKTNRAKELLSQIFGVTSGAFVIPDDNEFAHKNLYEIFEMFMIRHPNFDSHQIVEDLQHFIYTYTMAESESYFRWTREIFAERGLDVHGNEIKPEVDEPKPEVTEEVKKLNAYQDFAVCLPIVLRSEFLPFRLRESLTNELKRMSKSISPESRENLGEFNISYDYLTELFECYAEETKTNTIEDVAEFETAEPSYSEKLFEHNLQNRTNKICHVLASDKVSEETKEAFRSIILEAANEAGLSSGGYDPELVKIAFPKIIKSLGSEYGKGIYDALTSLLDSNLVAPIEDELRQYEKRFESSSVNNDSETYYVAPDIDVSESAPAYLKAESKVSVTPADEDDDEKTLQIGDLGISLYKVLHNPQLPSDLYEDIMVGLNEMFSALPAKKQKNLELTEEYLTDLLSYHIEQQKAEEKPESNLESLAKQISEILQNPLLPEKLYDVITDEINDIDVNVHTPENVLHNLELLISNDPSNFDTVQEDRRKE